MPNQKPPRIPSYRLHKPTGLAVVRLNGHDLYLGKHGSPESHQGYNRVIAEWLANPQQPGPQAPTAAGSSGQVTVNELFLVYWRFAATYYVKDGQPTSQIAQIKLAAAPLTELYGTTLAAAFGPKALKAVRQKLVDRDMSLLVVNQYTGIVKRIFRWGVENEMVPPSVYHGLQAVAGLRRGRCDVRVNPRIGPALKTVVDATLRCVSPQIRAMVQLQLVTGMRPGEATGIRGCDLDTTGKVWVYTPASHKTQHYGKRRQIYLGPQAQRIVKDWLKSDVTAHLFSPAEAEQSRNTERRRERETPMTPSQARRRRKPNPKICPHDRYTKDSFRRAVARACEKAFPAPAELATAPQGETEKQKVARLEKLRQWHKDHHWHPNQLRHNAATFLRKQYGLDAARVILGHSSPVVTEVYAELDQAKAMQIMAEVG